MSTLSDLVTTSRALGANSDYVMHGGGNTSAKGSMLDITGEELEVLWVKGSGWDLATIEEAGFPALDLAALRRMRTLSELSDEDMVRELRRHMLDPGGPSPSVETLLHAFLPHRFILHSHADAILAISNQEGGEEKCRQLFGNRLAYLPFVMPGFPLAKAVAEAVESNSEVEGVFLHHHGLFTFADEAKAALDLHREFVELAADQMNVDTETADVAPTLDVLEWAPILRGACSRNISCIFSLRQSPVLLQLLSRDDARDLFVTPPLTPDHALRTKSLPCWIDSIETAIHSIDQYREGYLAYFKRGCEARGERVALDAAPRVLLVPGLGVVGTGNSRRAAEIAADIAEHTLITKAAAADSGFGAYRGLPELDLFDMEYWSLEQAKLGRNASAELQGKVAVITGGAGAIGEGVAVELLKAGAEVALLDISSKRAEEAAERIGAFAQVVDVTNVQSMEDAVRAVCARFGGIDILVPNAGLAAVSPIYETDPEEFRRLVEVNQTGAFLTIQAGARVMRSQGRGGSIVLISSKNVAAPGADFSAYSSSKAGMHQLGRVSAIELAADGIRVNMICPDAVFQHHSNPSGLWAEVGPARAQSKGLAPEELEEHYRQRNLLKVTVSASDVGRAVLFFAACRTPTTGASLPVDGGIIGVI